MTSDMDMKQQQQQHQQLTDLLRLMIQQNYSESYFRAIPEEITQLSEHCQELISRNGEIQVIPNSDGALCAHYPPWLLLPSTESFPAKDSVELINKARFARGRSRFVVSCLNFRGKNVCRSSTLSGSLELYGRQVANVAGFSFDGSSASLEQFNTGLLKDVDSESDIERSALDRVRDADCELMQRFHVRYICDFMVEYRKFKYWIPITSSEKADNHNRYHEFVIIPLPYPGSEFFRIWRDSGYAMRNLYFNWSQPQVEVELRSESIPKTLLSAEVNWVDYKSWDITTITKNYLKLLLGLVFEGAGGMLLHCISGWDRTPMFVSLIRCLLWAEDFVHQSLSCAEMLYLTLAYDWFLFGHKLLTRMDMGEEILRFAFCFLGEIASHTDLSIRDTYNIVLPSDEPSQLDVHLEDGFVQITGSPRLLKQRSERLQQLSSLFLHSWENVLKPNLDAESSLPQSIEFAYDATAGSLSSVHSHIQTIADTSVSGRSVVHQISSTMSSVAAAVARGLSRPIEPTRPADDEPVSQVPP